MLPIQLRWYRNEVDKKRNLIDNATSQVKIRSKGKSSVKSGLFPKAHENIKEDKS